MQTVPADSDRQLALDYIQKNYMDPDLSLNSICSYLNISTSYFSTIFKDLTGENIYRSSDPYPNGEGEGASGEYNHEEL